MVRSRPVAVFAAIVVVLGCAAQSKSEDGTFTLAQVLDLARAHAPAIVSARGLIGEADGRLAGALPFFRENPVWEAGIGRRSDAGGSSSPELRFGFTQTIEIGGKRRARVAGARAGLSQARASADDVTRRVLRDIAVAFYRVLHAEARLAVVAAADSLAAEVLRIAERRYQAGDTPRLDVLLSRAALAGAHADLHSAESLRDEALAELRIGLGLGVNAPLAVRGDLRGRRPVELPVLLGHAANRPDIEFLQATLDGARADYRLGRARALPDLRLGVEYERDAGDDVTVGLVSFTLPLFDRGQGLRGESRARARRLEDALAARRRAVEIEVRTAFAVYQRRVQAADELEHNALPLFSESENLARRGYESGQIGLTAMIVVRREVLETQLEHIDRLFEAAVAGADLAASAGILP